MVSGWKMGKKNSLISNPLCIFNDLQFCKIIVNKCVSVMIIWPQDEDIRTKLKRWSIEQTLEQELGRIYIPHHKNRNKFHKGQ